ncbi:MAG: T9SS type A sorting domain-containing protein [Terrimonas sp.]|nr:T9SS type A sorting domain-containing protein [Terrimonas sp.]
MRIEKNTAWISSIINPVKNNIQFTVQAEQQGKLSVKLIDIQGRIILQSTQTLKQGINNIQLPATQLAKGMYLLELVQDGKRVVEKLMKD